ncbi:class I SAM-dependent methyltransferase [Mycolicibacterium sp.]|uniref:class I SAM-dependent methyltransferase n=1 Tax=Mycolicibacterium sp. TaxID=2320850 RepID=UPI001A2A174D|nr:class I SAM-dependent methyltransferase [Mycolicibacterium sp.]MBJ7336896.1 class I SAM-dependent methyltransferase [Mycolicibacterium sp.]
MSTRPPVHTDRRRAESFGTAALEYDRCRPRYPATLIADLVVGDGVRALDVGAGTGIASAQLSAAGADVLAIEPDARMARVAADKGLAVEQATFEEWDPGLRSFDLVVFAQSFHWVRPRSALEKVAALLEPGGRLALLWNRITPRSPSVDDLNAVYAGHLDVTARPSIEIEDQTTTLLQECGFTVERRHVVEELHFGTDAWLELVFTYSNHLALEPMSRAQLRSQLADRIGPDGVDATNDALAVVAVRRPQA